jgi:hypothetical protein
MVNSGGGPKLMVAGSTRDGKLKAVITDLVGERSSTSISFESGRLLNAISALPDMDVNGGSWLAALGTNMGNGAVSAELRDATSGMLSAIVSFKTTDIPQSMGVLPDINGNGSPELVVLGSNVDSDQVLVQIRDAKTGKVIRNLSSDPSFRPHALAVIPDLNGNGTAEILLAGPVGRTGVMRLRLRDALTGTVVNDFRLDTIHILNAMAAVPDMNGNGAAELVALGLYGASGRVRVEVKDMRTGFSLSSRFLGLIDRLCGMTVIPDTSGNSVPELAVIGKIPDTETSVLQIRDLDTWDIVMQGLIP